LFSCNSDQLVELKPKFVEAAKEIEKALNDTSFMGRFETYGETLSKMGIVGVVGPKTKGFAETVVETKLEEGDEGKTEEISLSLDYD